MPASKAVTLVEAGRAFLNWVDSVEYFEGGAEVDSIAITSTFRETLEAYERCEASLAKSGTQIPKKLLAELTLAVCAIHLSAKDGTACGVVAEELGKYLSAVQCRNLVRRFNQRAQKEKEK